ncbi:MAG TPA: sigma-70 family RNA polymerase sigma factor [Baekduia sp.]|uniref:sigma-70 family RNA polymerase sigma factor n=1 Tax=Baekduia sp. TaxID=2600305 RepID=UPI002D0AE3F3|nr:sigma-70 family RNA polymerase sigma factor [Baekduia sp.]HMJ34799.1 sigma-70 family RNA polymerase sigma factor [Baekduia sp.]
MRTASPLEHVIAHQDDYVRRIHGHFFRALSTAACADAVQDAFIAASQSDDFAALDGADQCGAWVRTRAYRNAIDQIRILKGRPDRGAPERFAVVSLDDLPLEALPGEPDYADDDPRADDAAAVLEAFNRLPDAEQRVIGLRHLDNLDRRACARLLGLSETQYKRKHTEAVRRLINLVIQTRPHDTCLQARTLIDLSINDMLDHDSVARRDAHLAGCAHCRQYQRRSRGLLIFVPLPAVAFSDRFVARLHSLLERFMPVVQNADAATTAGGAGAIGAGGAKLAAIVAASVATVGGGTVVIHHQVTHHAPAKAAVVQARPVGAPAAAPTTTTTTAPLARSANVTRAAAAAKARAKARAKAEAAARRKEASASVGSGELKPLGHEITVPSIATAAAAPPPVASTPSPTHTKSAPVAVPTQAPADSSSGEFAPHP